MSTRRALFTTPARPTKRRRTTPARRQAPMRIPKSLMPEMKQYYRNTLVTNGTSYAYSEIPLDMAQGDTSQNFDGAKFRIHRIRVNYDFSQASLSGGVRMMLIIPKDVSFNPTALISSARDQIDTNLHTVLFDRLVSDDLMTAAGTFDWKGPLNVEMNVSGTAAQRNNVFLYVYGNNAGLALRDDFSYSVWFTG